jgi:hypothetical protein
MYVHTIGDDYVYLNFDGNEGDVFECKPEELQGIPLTEELLEKMGFWKHPKADLYECAFGTDEANNRVRSIVLSLKFGLVNITDYVLPELPIKDSLHSLTPSCAARIKYLHELQNLYWDLTKQELKIKL